MLMEWLSDVRAVRVLLWVVWCELLHLQRAVLGEWLREQLRPLRVSPWVVWRELLHAQRWLFSLLLERALVARPLRV